MKFRALCVGLLATLLAGCAGHATTSGPASSEPDPKVAQAWAIGDGSVTEQEYRQAVDRYVSCMSDAGYAPGKPAISPVDGLTLLFDIEPIGVPAVWNATIDRCNLTNLSDVEPMYIEAREQVMEPRLREATRKCLSAHAVPLTGSEHNVTEFVRSAGGSMQTVMGCVNPALRKLFPALPHELKVRW
jgi:hypothetical protein